MKNKTSVVIVKEQTKTTIAAKVTPDIIEKMDEVQNGLGIPTRNELIIRAITLYYANYRHGIEQKEVTQ